ncbi:hypothetical protein Q73A0000_13745 [Kaistella flava (ex Peng et al. 2021)]|uniref:Molecular chaperone GroES n=1 Tax=Kaistella flava (ex Peng et al. 2021) TaxID=2038776 RepID=A0A7M2YB49_9FLAO|nr:hypothetical protein [Kaistella flava (ex Peng et al. 2021)]QOW11346.1 hypothetical protein Q73A0000_13745 [Kaistella flava (ex Peng et al. 2021)]
MKKFLFLYLIALSPFFFAQNVVLNKVVKSHPNDDKVFYKINPKSTPSEYLGEVEVQGFSDNDAKVFGMIYQKAKEIGANAFSYEPFEAVDGTLSKFDPIHYKLSLYYVSTSDFPKEENMVYFISSPYKKQTISINNDKKVFEPRTYTELKLKAGEIYTISTRKLLGSSIKIAAQVNQPVQYFQLSGASVNSNEYGNPGINLKSGDIIRLEQSYGQFLTTIYQYFK